MTSLLRVFDLTTINKNMGLPSTVLMAAAIKKEDSEYTKKAKNLYKGNVLGRIHLGTRILSFVN